MSNKNESEVNPEWFQDKAAKNQWPEFDSRVKVVCNLQPWLDWTVNEGLISDVLNLRDLAISILEKTGTELDSHKMESLSKIMVGDENMHLRRKAAIALWRHGNKDENVRARLNEALSDDELREEVGGLLNEVTN